MKNYLFYFLAFIVISFAACSDDDNGDGDGGNNSCMGQTEALSITVEGAVMSNITGTADIGPTRISVKINGDSSNDSRVFFSFPNAVGIRDLKLDFTGNNSQTVTAFVPAVTLNIILSTGCFEVVSIDESEVVMRYNIEENDTSLKGEIALEVI